MSPKIGLPFSMSAMLITNSSLRLINSLVPSSGSMHQDCVQDCLSSNGALALSSPVIGMPKGERYCSIIVDEARSAWVTGEPSVLSRKEKSCW